MAGPLSPGGVSKRDTGVTVTVVAVLDPTWNDGATTSVCVGATAKVIVSPAGLEICSAPVSAASTPLIVMAATP
ncbi:hypothetical protein ACC848_37635, partial [Rhizobium johnstonii]